MAQRRPQTDCIFGGRCVRVFSRCLCTSQFQTWAFRNDAHASNDSAAFYRATLSRFHYPEKREVPSLEDCKIHRAVKDFPQQTPTPTDKPDRISPLPFLTNNISARHSARQKQAFQAICQFEQSPVDRQIR